MECRMVKWFGSFATSCGEWWWWSWDLRCVRTGKAMDDKLKTKHKIASYYSNATYIRTRTHRFQTDCIVNIFVQQQKQTIDKVDNTKRIVTPVRLIAVKNRCGGTTMNRIGWYFTNSRYSFFFCLFSFARSLCLSSIYYTVLYVRHAVKVLFLSEFGDMICISHFFFQFFFSFCLGFFLAETRRCMMC